MNSHRRSTVGTSVVFLFLCLAIGVASSRGAGSKVENPAEKDRSSAADRLLIYFTFDHDHSFVLDSSQHGNHAIPFRDPRHSRAGRGKCIVLDGVDDHLRIPANENLSVSNLTVSVWVAPRTYCAMPESYTVLSSSTPQGEEGGCGLYLWPRHFIFGYITTRMDYERVQSPDLFTSKDDGRWHHLVATYRHDGRQAEIRLFLDGAMVKAEQRVQPVMRFSSSPRDIYMGIDYRSRQAFGRSPCEFDGCIDEFRLYGAALEMSQVRALYERDRKSFQKRVLLNPGPESHPKPPTHRLVLER